MPMPRTVDLSPDEVTYLSGRLQRLGAITQVPVSADAGQAVRGAGATLDQIATKVKRNFVARVEYDRVLEQVRMWEKFRAAVAEVVAHYADESDDYRLSVGDWVEADFAHALTAPFFRAYAQVRLGDLRAVVKGGV